MEICEPTAALPPQVSSQLEQNSCQRGPFYSRAQGFLWPPQPPLQRHRWRGLRSTGAEGLQHQSTWPRGLQVDTLRGWAAAPGLGSLPGPSGKDTWPSRQLPETGAVGTGSCCPGCCPDSSVIRSTVGCTGGGGPHSFFFLTTGMGTTWKILAWWSSVSFSGHPGGPEAAFEADKYHFLCKAVKSA